MDQLYLYIGIDSDVPAGDIGVGGREITYMYDEYKKKSGKDDGALTGKSLKDGGSILRPEATGYGLCYYTEALLKDQFKTTFKGKKVLISGSGNVATFACEKAQQLGAKVLTMSDSSSAIYDPEGIDLKAVRAIKEGHRGRIHEYLESHPNAQEMASNAIWGIPCDIALPCATQFEIKESYVDTLIQNRCLAVCEGSNMVNVFIKKICQRFVLHRLDGLIHRGVLWHHPIKGVIFFNVRNEILDCCKTTKDIDAHRINNVIARIITHHR